jgi:(p)ppGpp synthase/HD superfamily hydrolase
MHASVNHKYDGRPYKIHLKMVHKYAKRYISLLGNLPAYRIELILAACWMHDTIEDCRLTYNDVKAYCGFMIAEITFALSNEKGKTRKDRGNAKYYDDMKKVDYAPFIKICDRLANIEYSKKHGSSMFEKYKSEHSEFCKKLYDQRFIPMFDAMEKMLNIK